MRISRQEFDGRSQALLTYLKQANLTGIVLFDSVNILYITGFAFIPTERPLAFVLNGDGERALFVPRLEEEHAQAEAAVDRLTHYLEYPGTPHPMEAFKKLLADMGILPKRTTSITDHPVDLKLTLPDYLEKAINKPVVATGNGRLGGDMDGYPWIFGYEGLTLTELTGLTVVNVQGQLNRMQAIKSEAELALIRESSKWAHLAHRLLQKYTAVGVTESSVSLRATQEATLAMLDAIGPLYRSQNIWSDGPGAYYRGQIGRHAAIPHALANNLTFRPGDVLVTGATCPMWGYLSELERTLFVGEPNVEQQQFFSHMKAAQETALQAIKPGRKCSEVDTAVRAYYEEHNLMPYWKHHTGHNIGLRYHEGPFLDSGDDTVIQPGMVFTVEPGLYAPNLGGFRHSDTVAVTEGGIKMITYYPRDWPSLVIPI
jgi:Xaa-Pro aminopeptidase